jgi:hypothetical protein
MPHRNCFEMLQIGGKVPYQLVILADDIVVCFCYYEGDGHGVLILF